MPAGGICARTSSAVGKGDVLELEDGPGGVACVGLAVVAVMMMSGDPAREFVAEPLGEF